MMNRLQRAIISAACTDAMCTGELPEGHGCYAPIAAPGQTIWPAEMMVSGFEVASGQTLSR